MKHPADDPPHLHGGDPQRELARFGLESRPLLDFSVNLSPLGPPPEVRRRWQDFWSAVEHYPSLEGDGVREFYGQRFGLDPESVLPGNGATELIYLAPRVLGFSRVVVVQPSYHDYWRACRLVGVHCIPLALRREQGFSPPDMDTLRGALRGADAVFLGHPNNPTGTLFEVERLRELALEMPHLWWLVDESFIQFTDGFPGNSLAFSGELPANVLVFHSLTKFYALAGLRLGAVVGAPEVTARLRAAKEPWSVNGIANRVAGELAGCGEYERRVRRLVRVERQCLVEGLEALPGVRVFPGAANFLLAQKQGENFDDLLQGLLHCGICVRDCRNFPGLEDGFLRVAVRGPEENKALLQALAAVLDG